MNKPKYLLKNKLYLLSGIGITMLYLLPYFYLWKDSPVLVHDFLDSLENLYLWARPENLTLSMTKVFPQKMGGLPFFLYPFVWFIGFTYYFFDVFEAFLASQIIMRVIAFIGMTLFLEKHLFQKEEKYRKLLIFTGTVYFSILPFYPDGMFKVAGIPLVLYSFLNFYKEKYTKYDWAIITTIPLFSQYFASYFFMLPFLAFMLIYAWYKSKRFPKTFFFSLIPFNIVGLISAYPLARYIIFTPQFAIQRVEFSKVTKTGIEVIVTMVTNFFSGHYHYASCHAPFVFLAALIAIILSFRSIKQKEAVIRSRLFIILSLLFLNILISVYFGLTYYKPFQSLNNLHPIITAFNLYRLVFIQPVTWVVIFVLSLSIIIQKIKEPRPILGFIIILHLFIVFSNSVDNHWPMLLGDKGRTEKDGITHMSYREFFSKGLFNKIKNYIGKDQSTYRVASIGIPPSVSIYNGFYTIDGYITAYPLEYKHKFRRVIAAELDKDPRIAENYDDWGCRVYIYPAELQTRVNYTKDEEKIIQDLQLNTKALKDLGAKYILSAVEIKDPGSTNLIFHKAFENNESPWKIFLYEVR